MAGGGYSRRFLFFEKDLLKEPVTKLPFSELKDVVITCTATGRGFLWLGDSLGIMRRVDGSLKVCMFKSHERKLSHCYQMKQNDILLTIGHDDLPTDMVKVWNMAKWDGEGMPFCSRIVQACYGDVPQSPITCIEVLDNMTCMVLGHENGVVQIFKGDVTRERHSKRRILQRMPRAITGLGIQSVQSNATVVYVTTESSIISIHISSKDNDQKTVLDQFGCPLKCTTMMESGKSSSNFVVAVKDAIYFYEPDSRGPCIAIDGEKSLIHFYKNYLVIVKQATQLSSSGLSMHQLTIFDYTNKFIAGDFPLTDVRAILCEWGSLFVLCGAPHNQIFKLIEKDTHSKLELLFSKNNYNLAIDIAKSQHYDEDGLADIFRRYADHLYKKKEYDKSIEEYIKTIGKLEASYVIQRFLDTSRIHNLTAYLQKLHRAKLATEDHTTLLLNCYTKLKDEENLNNFINSDQEVYYDAETAIRVLRQSNYYKQALGLAKRFKRHVLYLRILVEDLKLADEALQYINELPFDDALVGVSTHGKFLMSENPQESAKILEKLCSSPEATKLNVNDFLKIFVNNRAGLIEFLDRYISRTDSRDIVTGVVDTLLELCLYEMHPPELDKAKRKFYEKKVMDLLQKELPYDRLKALVLCHQRGFKEGFLYLCEVAKDYDQMIRYHMENNDYQKVLDTCKQYGDHSPDLWTEALSYFSHKPDCDDMIRDIIIHIDKENLISPLLVVQRLAEGGKNACQLGVVKDYLLRRLQAGQEQLESDQETIRKYRQETEQNREAIRKLTSKVKIFQMQKCTLCHQSLDPPSVHFLCDHSYHMHCFQSYTENENECPSCLIKNRQFLAEVTQWESERHSDGGLDIPSLVQASIKGHSNQKTNLTEEEFISGSNFTDSIETYPVQNASFQVLSNAVGQGLMWETQSSSHKEEKGFKPAAFFEDKLKEVSISTANITSGIINQVKSFAQSKNSSYSDLNDGSKNSTNQQAASKSQRQQLTDPKGVRSHTSSNPFGNEHSGNTASRTASSRSLQQDQKDVRQPNSLNPFEEPDSESSQKDYPDHLNPF